MEEPSFMHSQGLKNLSFHTPFIGVFSRPIIVIALLCIITIFFGWHIRDLFFKISVYDLIIEDLPETTRYQLLKEIFGSDEMMFADVLSSVTLFKKISFRKIIEPPRKFPH